MDKHAIESAIRNKFGRFKSGKSKNGQEYKVCCPFCPGNGMGRDDKYKLWINPKLGKWRCWRCPARGTVAKLLDMSISEIEVQEAPRERRTSEVPPGDVLIPLYHLEEEHAAACYMRDRGFNPDAVGRVYGVHYCERGRQFAQGLFDTTNTIVFPIWMGGGVVGWQSRLLYNPDSLTSDECEAMGFLFDEEKQKFIKPPKYFTSPGLTKGDVLYNYDYARQSNLVVVVEGPTDVLAAGPCSVGTLGKGISSRQTEMLKSWDVVVVMLDPGDAGEESFELVSSLSTSCVAVPVKLEGISDPGSGTTVELWKQIYKACCAYGVDMKNVNLGPRWSPDVLKKR